jgi:hypothetical protein
LNQTDLFVTEDTLRKAFEAQPHRWLTFYATYFVKMRICLTASSALMSLLMHSLPLTAI